MYGSITALTSLGANSSENVSNALNNLNGYLAYHYRFVGSNVLGVVYGTDTSLETGLKPSVVTMPVTIAGLQTVLLNAQINPENRDTIAYLRWGRFSVSEHSLPTTLLAASLTATNLQYPISGFSPGIVYSAQAVASNSAGLVTGNIVRFVAPPFELLPAPLFREWTALADSPDGSRIEAVSSGGGFLSLDSGVTWNSNSLPPVPTGGVTVPLQSAVMSGDGSRI